MKKIDKIIAVLLWAMTGTLFYLKMFKDDCISWAVVFMPLWGYFLIMGFLIFVGSGYLMLKSYKFHSKNKKY